jgi:hypothetical protein
MTCRGRTGPSAEGVPPRLRAALPLTVLALLWAGCANEIDLYGPDPRTPVLWWLLDADDSVHLARLQRTFQSPGQSALVAAGDPERLYFPAGAADLRLEELGADGLVLRAWTAERVDAAAVGAPKEPGPFADSAHVLYRVRARLDDGLRYRVRLWTESGPDTLRATVPLVDTFRLLYPPGGPATVDYADTGRFRFDWVSAGEALLYDAFWVLRYAETGPDGSVAQGEVRAPLFRNRVHEPDGGPVLLSREVFSNAFFTGLRGALPPAPPGSRELLGVDVEVAAGGRELYLLYLNNLATLDLSELFITGTYTNLEGALGLASSRRRATARDLDLSVATLDSLACGRFTRDLGFAREGGAPCP